MFTYKGIMYFYIIFIVGIFFENVITYTNNTGRDMLEALKYFENVYAKRDHAKTNKDIDITTSYPYTITADLLKVLHELDPKLLHKTDSIDQEDESDILKSNEIEIPGPNNTKIEARRFIEWLRKILLGGTGKLTTRRTTTKGKNTTKSVSTTKKRYYYHFKAEEDDNYSRRIMRWFKDLFVTTTSTTQAPYNDHVFIDIAEVENNLTSSLLKMNDLINKLHDEMKTQSLNTNSTTGYFVLKMPIKISDFGKARQKRDINNSTFNATIEDITKINTTNNIIKIDANVTQKNRRQNFMPNFDYVLNNNKVNGLETKKGLDIKQKLFEYLIEAFKDIKTSIAILTKTKQAYSGNSDYRIGYIVANIDTLDVNLMQLKHELEAYRNQWDEKKLLELFDRLKTSKNVINNLLESVQNYAKVPELPVV